MHNHGFHHCGARNVNFLVGRWARHVVGVVDGVHNWRVSRHGLWHRNVDALHFRDGVIVVLVHDGVWAELPVLVAAPARVLAGPSWIRLSVGAHAVVGLCWGHDLHSVDERRLRRHLHFDVVIHRNLPVHRVEVVAHH
eukprot:Skav202075  [mRNA]  locus=scaffold1138:793222:795959:+ [translate_table: standard]